MPFPRATNSLLALARGLTLILVTATSLALPVRAADTSDAAAKAVVKGRALAELVRTQRPDRAAASRGILKTRTADGRRVSVPLEVRVEIDTHSWKTIYRASFLDGRVETLTVENLEDASPRFALRRATAGGQVTEIRPERAGQWFAPFAATDFWFVDLGMAFLHWPEQRWLGTETRRTRLCNMLESVNPTPAPGAYKRVVTWVDEKTAGIVRAEAYDAQDKLLKEFSPGSFAKVGTRYELRDMEIRNEQTDSRTTLVFEIDDPEKLGVKHLPANPN